MVETDKAMERYFQQLISHYQLNTQRQVNQKYDHNFWWEFRERVIEKEPMLKHDVTNVRYKTYALGLSSLGLASEFVTEETEKAMQHFLTHRNKVNVPDNIPVFLTELKKRYPLIAISNGNVCTKSIGLAQYFDHVFHAGEGYKQKPANDLFHLASDTLTVKPQHILHVGDCGRADIFGAQRAGCKSAWLNCYDVGKPIKALADIELNQVTDLAKYF